MTSDQPRRPIIDVERTLRMLKKSGQGDLVKRFPKIGIVRQRQRLREVCEMLRIEPVYEAD